MDNLPLYNDDTQLLGSVATDEIANVHYPRSKIGWGDEGAYADVSTTQPLPVSAVQSGEWTIGSLTSVVDVVHVDDNDGSLTVDNAGTFAVQISSALPAGTNAIGAVAQSGAWSVSLADAVTISGTVTVVQSTAANLRTAAELYLGDDAIDEDHPLPVTIPPGSLVIEEVSISGTVTCDTELPAAAALADGSDNPTAPTVAAALIGFNGTTWDRLRSDLTWGLDVDVTRVNGSVAVTQSTATDLRTAAELYVDGVAVDVEHPVPMTLGEETLTVDGTVSISGTVTCDTELPDAAALADGADNPTAPAVAASLTGFNGATWDRLRSDMTWGLDVDVTRVNGSVAVTQSTATDLRTASELYVDGTPVDDANPVPVTLGEETVTVAGAVSISGTVTCETELPAASSLSDGAANPTAPAVSACLTGFNGSTWDRLRGDIAQGLDVDVTRVQGTVAVTQSGSWSAGLAAGTNSAGKFIPEASASGAGTSAFRHASLSNTAQSVKASAGRLYGLHCYNPNNSDVFLQFYDHASPTVGTTTPTRTYAVPARGWLTLDLTIPHAYATAIKVAATTTDTGGSAPSSGLLVNVESL